MYKSYKLVMFIVNTKGGESETVEHLTKESVDSEGKTILVPKTKQESILYMLNKVASVGGNTATQRVKAMLFNEYGDMIKTEEVEKDAVIAE